MRGVWCVLTVVSLAACGGGTATSASPGAGQPAPQRSSNVVTADEIQRTGGHDLQEVLKRLRPAWFKMAPTRIQGGGIDPIVVYIDGRHVGGLGDLRDLPLSGVLSVRYYSASEAQGRYGPGHLQGAIEVQTTR